MAILVSPDWVEERLDDPGFVTIDTRFSMRHLMGHLKSDVNVPPPRLRDSEGQLLSPDSLSQLFGGVGLGDQVTPVLYDGYDGRNVAMVAWALEYLGRDDVHIMGVFFDCWKDQGREIFYRPVAAAPRQFTARVNPALRASIDDISSGLNLKLVDTRSQEEYHGETDADEKPGHIPGAVNIVWQNLIGEGGQLLCSQEKMEHYLAEAGISQGDRIVTYCKVGARASVGYLAFQQLGYDVAVYDASYAEWEKSGLPVEI